MSKDGFSAMNRLTQKAKPDYDYLFENLHITEVRNVLGNLFMCGLFVGVWLIGVDFISILLSCVKEVPY